MSGLKPLAPKTLIPHVQSSDSAWFFDLDGTLLDMAPHPDAVWVPDSLINNLAALNDLSQQRVAIISGRSLADLERLIPIPVILVGNHGAEYRFRGRTHSIEPDHGVNAALDAVRLRVKGFLASFPGAMLEDKRLTLSLHYRSLPSSYHQGLEDALTQTLKAYPALIKRPAHACWEIRPVAGPTKGDAVSTLLHQLGSQLTPIVFGDDVTDEDAFLMASQGITVLVGRARPTHARYNLASPSDVRKLLQTIRRLIDDDRNQR